MVLDNKSHTLYIFAGQRDDKYLSDMYAYSIKTNSAIELFTNFSNDGGPDACFTQRAVLDKELKEIYTYTVLFSSCPDHATNAILGSVGSAASRELKTSDRSPSSAPMR